MQYLKLKRSRIILGAFAAFSLLLAAFPAIDLYISGLFFRGNAFPRGLWWQDLLHDGLTWFLCVSLGGVLAIYASNRALKRNLFQIDGRKVVYLFLVLIIGAGLIVNVVFKDHFGRARPRDVAEFGGAKIFTPAFVVAGQCKTNCSFSSGDAAGGFFAIALVLALRRRRAMFLAALVFGGLMSLARISSGAHFFSDTVVSFFVMLIVADVLYYYVVLTRGGRDAVSLANTGLRPDYAVASADLEIEAGQLPERRVP